MESNKRFARIHMFLVLACVLGLAVPAFGQVTPAPLVQGTPRGISATPYNYSITIQQGTWNVIGVCYQSFNWTLQHGSATSNQTGFVCNYVLADGFAGTITGAAGTASTTGSPVRGLICHSAVATLTPGTAATYNWANDMIYVWTVRITTAGTYNINVSMASSSIVANMKYAWFNPQNTAAWFDRTQAAFVNNMGTAQSNYSISATGTYCLVAYEDATTGSQTGTLTATVSTSSSSPSFQAVSVSVPGAPVSVNPGGTFTALSSIRNSGTGAGSTSYSIYLSADPTITTADTQVYTGSTPSIPAGGTNNASDACTVPAGQAAGSYYVGLYVAAGNTAVTANADVTVNSVGSPPGPFSLVSPANAATGVSTSPTYAWTASTGAATYSLQVATDAGMANLVVNKTGITGTSDTPATVLSPGTVYYWQVTAVNALGSTPATGGPWSFTTAAPTSPPGAFDLTSPANGATGVSLQPLYSWNASAGAVSYRLEVATDAGMGSLVVDKPGITGTFDIPGTSLAAGTTYYWRVTAWNTFGTTVSNAAPWSFTTNAFDPVASSIAYVNPPVRVPLGATFQATYSIVNNGSAAGSAQFEIYLSTDATIGSGDALLYFGITPSISPGAAYGQTLTFDLPASAAEGQSYYVGLSVAPGTTAVSADTLLVIRPVEPESALGCAAGPGGGGGAAGWVPLALLAALALAMRRRLARSRGLCGSRVP